MFGFVIVIGMNTALNTLGPQAAGSGDYKLALVYLRRGQLCLSILFLPMLILTLFSE